jgi:hypothetical protein
LNHTDEVLGGAIAFMAANTKRIGVLGARAMVLGTFLQAALPHLTTLQRVEIIRSFRPGIEDVPAAMDDVALPAEYHSALLEITNAILVALGQRSVTRESFKAAAPRGNPGVSRCSLACRLARSLIT